MDDDSKKKSQDVLSNIDPITYKWEGDTMATTAFEAQEIGSISIDLGEPVINIGSIDSNAWITGQTISIGASGSNATWSYTGGSNAGSTEYSKDYIKTEKHQINLDELAEMMETLKKRLLILAPNFEMHEKYPMLKELYDEYKAMEKLLSGPDTDEQ